MTAEDHPSTLPRRSSMSRTDTNPNTLTFRDDNTDAEFHAASATAHLLDELQLCGHRPGQDEADPHPLPEAGDVQGQIGAAVGGMTAMRPATRLQDNLADLLWSFVNLFHRKVECI